MDGENTVTDMPPGNGQQTDNAEVNAFSGQRCDSVRSIASSNGPVTPKRYAQDNMQGVSDDNRDATAATALMQMYIATQTGMRTDRPRLVTCSLSFPLHTQQAHMDHDLLQSNSYDRGSMGQPNAQYDHPPVYNVQHDANMYQPQNADFDLRNVVVTLSRAFTTLQEQQANMQQKQEHLTGALTGLTTILQTMQSNARGDRNETRPARDLNIPPGRGDCPTLSARGQIPQQSRILDSAEASEVDRSKLQAETHGNYTRGDTQYCAEAYLPSVQHRHPRYQNQGQQRREEARHERQGGINLEYGYQDTAGQGTFSRAEGQNPVDQQYEQSGQLQYAHEENSEGWGDYIRPRTRQNEGYRRSHYENRMMIPEAKLPPFSGKEEWKIWVSRFEAVAKRRSWDENEKLDNLLPRLQGKAGEFVFSQLPPRTLSNYEELVQELNSRFRVVETQRTFAAKFSQRCQRNDETVEEYAADLKRLYAKAYKTRSEKTKQENLVRRFLDGLKDHEARFEIEFHKEPDDIDTAVYHAVNFLQTRRRSSGENYADRKAKR